jgi:hypothetical protein
MADATRPPYYDSTKAAEPKKAAGDYSRAQASPEDQAARLAAQAGMAGWLPRATNALPGGDLFAKSGAQTSQAMGFTQPPPKKEEPGASGIITDAYESQWDTDGGKKEDEASVPPSTIAIPTKTVGLTTDVPSFSGQAQGSSVSQTQSPNVPAMQEVAQSLPRDPNKLKQTAEKVAQAMKQAKGTESEGFWRSIFQVVASVADIGAKGLLARAGRDYTTQDEKRLEQARQMAMLQAQQGFQAGESALDRAQTTSNIKLTGEQNANMQLAGHKFEAEQNRLDREFQKAQAEIQMAFQNRQMTQVEKNQQEQALIDWYNAETARNESEYRIWLSAGQPAGGFDFKGAAMEDTVSGGR